MFVSNFQIQAFLLSLLALAPTSSAFVQPIRRQYVHSREPLALKEGQVSENLESLMDAARDIFDGGAGASDSSAAAVADSVNSATDLFSQLNVPPEALYVLIGTAFLGTFVAVAISATSGSQESATASSTASTPKKKTPPPAPKVDVSVPYDAAARLAYAAWKSAREDFQDSAEAYSRFKTMYEMTTVAQVTAKQRVRDMANFDPSKPIVVRKQPVKTTKVVNVPTSSSSSASKSIDTSKTPYFASYSS